MSVQIAKNAGFCFGVSRAVELVEQAAQQGSNVVTLGPIIHNRHQVGRFEEMGVKVIDSPSQANKDMTVVIRSHGVTRAVYEAVEATGAQIIDATCPFVKRIHGIVSNAREEGRLPIIIGTRDHPEVEGIAGWCEECVICQTPEELSEWAKSNPESQNLPICIVCQTTSTENLWKSCVKIAKKTVY